MPATADHGRSVYQASYEFMCTMLCKALADGVRAGLGEEGVGSLRCRVSGALYAVLLDHPVDERGRCRSCRRPGAVFALRRRRCEVHREANYWLRQPDWILVSRGSPGVAIGPPLATIGERCTQECDPPGQSE
ncbi:MAG: hypothetical protein ACRDRW_11330 [Pseudonocardiaceae bacterium]